MLVALRGAETLLEQPNSKVINSRAFMQGNIPDLCPTTALTRIRVEPGFLQAGMQFLFQTQGTCSQKILRHFVSFAISKAPL
jgi:hypothetical protein